VIAPCACRHYNSAAHFTSEYFIACMGFIIPIFVLFPFVFSVQDCIPPKSILIILLGGLVEIILRKPPGQRTISGTKNFFIT
jgi:hypothetical protein